MLFSSLCFGTVWDLYLSKPQIENTGSQPKQLIKDITGFFSVRSTKKAV
jgi:hypothetical protein